MSERDEEKADAIDIIQDALASIDEAGEGLDAWQHHYLLKAFEHLHRGLYGEAITFAEDALTPAQERHGVGVPEPSTRLTIAKMRLDLQAIEVGNMR